MSGSNEAEADGNRPARELVALSSVLKTAGPTRNPDASGTRIAVPGPAPWCTFAIVTESAPPKQRHIALILAKDLAANLASAILLVDPDGDLVLFNEPAERIWDVPTPKPR